jgi:hypothetical protein
MFLLVMAGILLEDFHVPKLRHLSLVNLVIFLFFCLGRTIGCTFGQLYVSIDTEARILIHILVSKKIHIGCKLVNMYVTKTKQ